MSRGRARGSSEADSVGGSAKLVSADLDSAPKEATAKPRRSRGRGRGRATRRVAAHTAAGVPDIAAAAAPDLATVADAARGSRGRGRARMNGRSGASAALDSRGSRELGSEQVAAQTHGFCTFPEHGSPSSSGGEPPLEGSSAEVEHLDEVPHTLVSLAAEEDLWCYSDVSQAHSPGTDPLSPVTDPLSPAIPLWDPKDSSTILRCSPAGSSASPSSSTRGGGSCQLVGELPDAIGLPQGHSSAVAVASKQLPAKQLSAVHEEPVSLLSSSDSDAGHGDLSYMASPTGRCQKRVRCGSCLQTCGTESQKSCRTSQFIPLKFALKC